MNMQEFMQRVDAITAATTPSKELELELYSRYKLLVEQYVALRHDTKFGFARVCEMIDEGRVEDAISFYLWLAIDSKNNRWTDINRFKEARDGADRIH